MPERQQRRTGQGASPARARRGWTQQQVGAAAGQAGGTAASGMGSTMTEAQLNEVVAAVLARLQGGQGSPASAGGGSQGPAAGSGGGSSSSGQGSSIQQVVQKVLRRGPGGMAASSSAGTSASSAPPAATAVAEVLTEAQWQLSRELEANLKELRQVIRQSESIAQKIESVLGQDSGGQSQQ